MKHEEKISALKSLRAYIDAEVASGKITEEEGNRWYSFEESGFFLEP